MFYQSEKLTIILYPILFRFHSLIVHKTLKITKSVLKVLILLCWCRLNRKTLKVQDQTIPDSNIASTDRDTDRLMKEVFVIKKELTKEIMKWSKLIESIRPLSLVGT